MENPPEIEKLRSSLIDGDLERLEKLVSQKPKLVNQEIRWGQALKNASVPLHFIADAHFEGWATHGREIHLANLLIEFGADVNRISSTGRDTPLIGAASLHCDQLGITLIDAKCELHHRGTHGGQAIHWAAWTGSLNLVDYLLHRSVEIESKCEDFGASVLFWAIHGYCQAYLIAPRPKNQRQQVAVAKKLIRAGADLQTRNRDNATLLDLFPVDSNDALETWLTEQGCVRSNSR